MQIGSDAHKQMFCKMLLDTHNPYKPAVIDWPALPPEALQRLTSLPIWDIAVQTEGRASIRVATFAATVSDPLLRAALDMDAAEEARHKVVLSKLVEAYGIRLAREPAYPAPKDAEWAWMVTGFSECIDSFFAFGLFRCAQRSGYFPEELVETFEPVIQEEGRHILFFANWFGWYWRNTRWWRRPWLFARVAAVWAFLIWERIGIARGTDVDGVARDTNFPANTAATVGDALNPRELIELCLAENDRRMAGYDTRLLRPTIVPRLARFALRFIRR
ncbi:hypothetical protein BTHA_4127 [Burkholderia thailandensis MSMB59]|nr:hypothetical protein BTHA_4127 [Burkholderia thailandensis MSMB59]